MPEMEKAFRLWFIASLSVMTVLTGWSVTQYGLTWGSRLLILLLLCWIPVSLGSANVRSRKKKRTAPQSALAQKTVSIVVFLLCGILIAKTNVLRANDWLSNSVALLQGIVSPVKVYDGDEGRYAMTDAQQKKLHEEFAEIGFNKGALPQRLLMSFKTGLALVDRNDLRFVTDDGFMLALSEALPDGSFMLYNAVSDRLAPSQQASAKDTFTRAIIRDGVLYKLWERKTAGLYIHHWGDAFDGKIYQPGRTFVQLPTPDSRAIGGSFDRCSRLSVNDRLLVFDQETGDLLNTVDILPLIGELRQRDDTLAKAIWSCSDPIHFNDVQIVKTDKVAREFPGGQVGDILISMREISTLALLDKDTHAIKWYMRDTWRMQHSPRFTDRGTLLILDNRGGSKENGRSRILEIDVAMKKIIGTWEATGNEYFDTDVRGKLLLLGNKIVVQIQSIDSKPSGMFVLDCPRFPVSKECTKTDVFNTKIGAFNYDNAVFLP